MEQNFATKNTDSAFQNIREIQKFNWGALFFWWIWGAFNGAFKQTFIPWIILVVIYFIPVINICALFAGIGIMVYFGLNGNKWAWESKHWNSIEHFNSVQKKWAIATAIFGAITIMLVIGIIYGTIMSLKAMNSYISEDYKTESYITTINYDSELKYSPDSKTLTGNLYKSLKTLNSKTQSYDLYNENTISVKTYNKATGKTSISELYTFNKNGSECSIEKKNCYIVKYGVQGNKMVAERKTYFDGKGQTEVVIMQK